MTLPSLTVIPAGAGLGENLHAQATIGRLGSRWPGCAGANRSGDLYRSVCSRAAGTHKRRIACHGPGG